MPSAQQQQAARTAWSQWNPNNYQGGIPPELLNGILNNGWRASPDADYSGSISQFVMDPSSGEIQYHPQGQGPGEQYAVFDNNGKFLRNDTGSKVQSYASGVLSVLGAGLGMGMVGGAAAGAAGTAGGAGGGVAGLGDAGTMYAGADAGAAGSLGGGGSMAAGGGMGAAGAAGVGAAGAGGVAGAGGAGGAAGGATGAAGAGGAGAAGGGASLFGGSIPISSLVTPGLQALGGLAASSAQKNAANQAANAQETAAQAGIDERRSEFNNVQQLLGPFVQAGYGSLKQQQDLSGANGPQAQQAAITALQQTPGFQSQLQLGENRILQNASATGGLRGGNTQGALGYFSPTLLAQTINDQYGRLGGITSLGQNAAAGVGNAGMATGAGISGLLQQQGSAGAGAALAGGRAQSNLYSSFLGALGQYVGNGGGFGTAGARSTGGGSAGVVPDAVNMGTSTGADAALFW